MQWKFLTFFHHCPHFMWNINQDMYVFFDGQCFYNSVWIMFCVSLWSVAPLRLCDVAVCRLCCVSHTNEQTPGLIIHCYILFQNTHILESISFLCTQNHFYLNVNFNVCIFTPIYIFGGILESPFPVVCHPSVLLSLCL